MSLPLPVDDVIGDILNALAEKGEAILQAPPGAGKTTRVPLALLKSSLYHHQKILVLEPRRLAAVTCAQYMADLLGEPLGRQVGYRVRLDHNSGPDTRVEVITQGIFIRMIQSDPGLDGVGLVIFDEFHERNLYNDLGFALCLDARQAFCESLHVLVMSATLDTGKVSGILSNAPVIKSEGKTYPVQTRYCPAVNKQNRPVPIETACVQTVLLALKETHGDILVFLPGQREIRQVHDRLTQNPSAGARVLPLYGNLTRSEQMKVFLPAQDGGRKVVLATAIAETSITIDGIGVVIDAGLMRLPRYSPQTGMTRLETIRVSKAAADQRRGRAGRTGPGICYRLWSEYEQGLLSPYTPPELHNADLSGLVLELASWGIRNPGDLVWLDAPKTGPFQRATALLQMLGCLNDQGRITDHGRMVATIGLHPRAAHMALAGIRMGMGKTACMAAVMLGERDILISDDHAYEPDAGLRLETLLQMNQARRHPHGYRVKYHLARQILTGARVLEKRLNVRKAAENRIDPEDAGQLFALAFPDRIAKKRKNQGLSYIMASGKGAVLSQSCLLEKHEFIVVLNQDGNPRNAKIFLAAAYSEGELKSQFKDQIIQQDKTSWDEDRQMVKTVTQHCFGQLIVNETPWPAPDSDKAGPIFLDQIRRIGMDCLPWTRFLLSLRNRAVFLRKTGRFDDLPDLSDKGLTRSMEDWLAPFLQDVYSLKQLKGIDLTSVLQTILPWRLQSTIDVQAPTHLVVPSGSKLPLDYTMDQGKTSPVLAVRLQEMFSLNQTPKIAENTISVTLHLLSPAGRPVQITDDLESFWKNTYPDVKKDLMGRYPKHYWPEDPLTATPTNRAKPRK